MPAGPIGPGCDVFAPAGPGGVAGAPVGAAISTVPQLSTLTQAVLSANLVDVLNTRTDVTVLAPSNAAFDALGPDALPALLADVPRLTTVLTHHVVSGRLTPDQLVGEHTTLNGDSITVVGPGRGADADRRPDDRRRRGGHRGLRRRADRHGHPLRRRPGAHPGRLTRPSSPQ